MHQDDYTLIENYLLGKLNEAEQQAFRLRLDEEAAFKEAYDLQKSMNIFLEKDRNQPAIQNQLQDLGKEFFLEKEEAKVVPIQRNRSRRLIGIISAAAAIALLLFLWNPFQPTFSYEKYAAHTPLSLTEKSTASDAASKAEKNFNDKNYAQAYQDLTIYLQNNSDDVKAQLALGIAALESGKTSEAINVFTAIKDGTSALQNYGTWYLALTYLKSEDFEKAKPLLNAVKDSDKKIFEDAREILGRLE